MSTVRCRAGVSEHCRDGVVLPPQAEPMEGDSTYDGETIICTPCYVVIEPFARMNQPDIPYEMNQALGIYERTLRHVQRHPHPEQLVDQAGVAVAESRAGSPRCISALACKRMAEAEIERRQDGVYRWQH